MRKRFISVACSVAPPPFRDLPKKPWTRTFPRQNEEGETKNFRFKCEECQKHVFNSLKARLMLVLPEEKRAKSRKYVHKFFFFPLA